MSLVSYSQQEALDIPFGIIMNFGDDILTSKIKSAQKNYLAHSVFCLVAEIFNFLDHIVIQG